MQEISQILDRIIKLKGLKNDKELAKLFSVAPNTISSWRSRGSIPYEKIIAFCVQEGFSLDYVFPGEGSPFNRDAKFVADVSYGTYTSNPISDEEYELIKAVRELDPISRKGVYLSAITQFNEAMREKNIRKDKRKKEILDKTIKVLTKAIGED